LDEVEVGVGDGELLRRPGKCRDLVAGGERLLDQLSAGGAGGAEDGEVHGSAPIFGLVNIPGFREQLMKAARSVP
jgi:hypothetical protein